MRFGPNSRQVTIRRRALGTAPGVVRGDFADAFATWASWRAAGARQIVEAGLAEDAIDLVLRVSDTSRNRTIGLADRVRLGATDYAIATVGPPDRAGGFIEMTLRRQIGG